MRMFQDFKLIFEQIEEYTQIRNDVTEDQDIRDIALEELNTLQDELEERAEEVIEVILPKNDAD